MAKLKAFLILAGFVVSAPHEHPDKGPHGGELIELGDEEYHAELVHRQKAGTVTIHVLDSAAEFAVATEAPDATINLKAKGKPRQFKLAAKPMMSDPKGAASRFVSMDKELGALLEDEKAEARLRIVIKGKTYVGKIEHHHHDHETGE